MLASDLMVLQGATIARYWHWVKSDHRWTQLSADDYVTTAGELPSYGTVEALPDLIGV